MPDDFLDPILERIAREQRASMRIGAVTAIDATNAALTVSLAGDVVSGVRWVGSYTPTVADVVVISRVDAMWVVLGKLSKQLGGATVIYGTTTIIPATTWDGFFAEDYWSWSVSADGSAGQGTHEPYGVVERRAGSWYTPNLAGSLPVGATVTAAKLRLTRWAAPAEGIGVTPEADLVTPRLRLHTYTTIPSGAPTWTGTAWSPGSLGRGQPGVWDLPSAWLTALLAGTATGIGTDTAAYADYTRFSNLQLELAYSTPA